MNVIVKFSFMEEWKKYKMSDFIDFNPTISLKKGTVARKITMDKLIPHSRDIYEWEYEPYSGGSKFQNGDTIMARITPCLENGKHAFISLLNDGETAYGSTEYIVMRGIPGISDNRFVYYLSHFPDFKNAAVKSMVGSSGRQRAQVDVLKNLEFYLPGLKEQRKIADTLSALDDKIALNNRINHNLEEQADCLISSAIETQSIGSAHLWDICSYVTERVNNDTLNNKNYISTDNMFANKGGIGIASTIPDGKCTSFKVRDVLVSNIRPYFKKIWRASFSGGCSNDVLCFRTTKGTSSFLYHLLRSDVFFDFVMSGAKGSKMPRGDKQHIMNWTIPVFEKAIIISLEDSLEVIDDRVAIIQEENRRLSAIRDSLLPMLMTNSIYINDLTC